MRESYNMRESAPKQPQHKEEEVKKENEEEKESKIQVSDEHTSLTEKQQKLVEEWREQAEKIATGIFFKIRVQKSKFELEDVISWGMLGFMEAIHKFDSSKNDSFISFASLYIKRRIIDNLRTQSLINRGHRKFLKDHEKAIKSLQNKLSRKPTPEEIAKEMGFTFDSYLEKLNIFPIDSEVVSLTDLSNDNGHQEDEKEKIEFLHKFLDRLRRKEKNKRNRRIMDMYFSKRLTCKKIGEIVGLSESRVFLITEAVIKKLRKLFEKQGYEVFPKVTEEENNNNNKLIGEKIRQARENAGISQLAVAKKLGYSHDLVSFMEAGKREISKKELKTITTTLNEAVRHMTEEENRNNIIRENIRQARENAGISQLALAKKLGYKSPDTVSDMEAGKRKVSEVELKTITEILNEVVRDMIEEENRNKIIGENIRQAREDAGILWSELAKELGYKSHVVVPLIEAGKRKVSEVELKKIANMLNKDISYFIGQPEEQLNVDR